MRRKKFFLLMKNVSFYLESRGIPAQECYNMLAAAKLLAVCGKIPDDGIRNEIHDYIKEVY